MALPGPLVLERAGLACWPGIETEWDGAWVRRAANGYTQRANSVQSLDVADDADAGARIDAAVEWFRARNIRPTFRVTPLAGPRVVAALDAAGWAQIDDSHVFAMELGSIDADPRAEICGIFDPAFLAAQESLQGYSEERFARLRAILEHIAVPAAGIVVRDADGAPVASGLFDVADGIVYAGNIITEATRRRQGYGAALMRTGLAWGRSAGAQFAALNVAADNPAGQALYRSLGYERQYDYTYRYPVSA
jgi:ribosomal protein S18 acetylase RimI-like enzyme